MYKYALLLVCVVQALAEPAVQAPFSYGQASGFYQPSGHAASAYSPYSSYQSYGQPAAAYKQYVQASASPYQKYAQAVTPYQAYPGYASQYYPSYAQPQQYPYGYFQKQQQFFRHDAPADGFTTFPNRGNVVCYDYSIPFQHPVTLCRYEDLEGIRVPEPLSAYNSRIGYPQYYKQ